MNPRRRKLIWQLFPTYLLITLVCVGAVTWYAASTMRGFHVEQTQKVLTARAGLIMDRLAPYLAGNGELSADAECREIGRDTHTRVTVILPSGQVIGDSDEPSWTMENHADRPEVAAALKGKPGHSERFSNTLKESMVYVALPVEKDGAVIGVLRTALPVTRLDKTLGAITGRIVVAGFFIALLAAVVSWLVGRAVTRPLGEMTEGAARFAKGELTSRLPVPESQELAELAEALNRMAAQLGDRIQTITRQRNEMEAVLGSMLEGVIAVDREERILRMNHSAARLLGRSPDDFRGIPVSSVIRNPEFGRFVEETFKSGEVAESDLTLMKDGSPRILHILAAPLRDADTELLGLLIMLNDVTRLRSLERMRQDFVSNVSHELKTPLTAIKGFVETLMQDGPEDEARMLRFLSIISRHVERIHSIIEDLLALSRIEHEDERKKLDMEPRGVNRIVQTAMSLCREKAADKKVAVVFQPGNGPRAAVDYTLIEQAVVNLLDNAVKYSPEGGEVVLSTGREGERVFIRCQDHGPGIPREHLTRIFERFYRVDKARSRQMGGTGLGLAIVKHIARAHGGTVSVESELGGGSVFTIHLPAAGDAD